MNLASVAELPKHRVLNTCVRALTMLLCTCMVAVMVLELSNSMSLLLDVCALKLGHPVYTLI